MVIELRLAIGGWERVKKLEGRKQISKYYGGKHDVAVGRDRRRELKGIIELLWHEEGALTSWVRAN